MTVGDRLQGSLAVPESAPTEEKRTRTEGEEKERKERLLTQGRASVTRSIAEAVVIKDGNLFFLSEKDGSVPLDTEHGLGLYYNDCRFLGGYELLVGGVRLGGLVASSPEGFRARYELSNPDIRLGDGTLIPKESLSVRIERLLDGDGPCMRERVQLINYGREKLRLPVTLEWKATFEDVFAVRGLLSVRRGKLHQPQRRNGDLVFAYDGADDVSRRLVFRFDPPPSSVSGSMNTYEMAIDPDETVAIEVLFHLVEETDAGGSNSPDVKAPRETETSRRSRSFIEANRRVDSDSILLNRALDASFRDLAMLRSKLEGYTYFAAGTPWFSTLFGRDSLIAALQALAFNAGAAEQTLRLLARFQGQRVDNWRDEQPGKILHEIRFGELARSGELPHTPYYGTVDATPLFLILVAEHARWTGSLGLFHDLRENVNRALDWLDRYGDFDGDGYVEYESATEKGLINQGWKDSGDAIVMAAGHLARPPIALVEVQGYVLAAKQGIADLFERAGDVDRASALREQAHRLKDRFNRDFWSEELGTYCLALEANKKQVAVVASNAGHALWAGIADPNLARRTGQRLMDEDMFSGWGIRTLSTREKRYNPIGYHLGTVWPHDNAFIAAGFKSYGLDDAALRVFEAVVNAASYYDHHQLPELMAGHDASEHGVPVRYPVACHPQAWRLEASPSS